MAKGLRGLWATAVASIKHAMDAGFTETDSTAAMLVIKDFMYLTAQCLASFQFDVSAIMASLTQYKDRCVVCFCFPPLLSFLLSVSLLAHPWCPSRPTSVGPREGHRQPLPPKPPQGPLSELSSSAGTTTC